MILKKPFENDEVDLDRVWRERTALFPRGLTGSTGAPVDGLFSVFATACARALGSLGLDRDLLDVAATEVTDTLVLLESRGLDRLPFNDTMRKRFELRFALPQSDKNPPAELVALSELAVDLVRMCRSHADLLVLSELFATIARKMATLENVSVVGELAPEAASL